MTVSDFKILLYKYVNQQLSEADLKIFFQQLELQENRPLIQEEIDKLFQNNDLVGLSSSTQSEESYKQFKKILSSRKLSTGRFLKLSWVRFAAAAVLFLIICAGVYFYFNSTLSKTDKAAVESSLAVRDVMP